MRIRNGSLCTILSCALALTTGSAAQQHHPEHTWDYGESKGPKHWGDLEPEFRPCKDGRRQSPIDIRNTQKADLPPIQFDYKPSALRIIDNGHTVMINYQPRSSISVGGHKYALKQFNSHRPGEDTVKGKGYEMEVHLVHADEEGELAVVAVLLKQGNDNPLVHELWNDLPEKKEKEQVMDGRDVVRP
jgi:carbonic anhydrase